ncbi:MAG: bifunctional NADP-dependent methylenetetrahydromethanopterin dehydrogenase/methylenetetrahydrofolate dehydrogenase [Planctomycetaceae bacterium]|nr:bifunctional NADP-dependent methylenetetrahydromethanopterin dehydrogenase/methylenetetrahydrofolate dehydrogenase [Planctomycetaceae bacterium]
MAKPKILLQFDPDPQPSVFDSVVAIDSGVDQLLRHGGLTVADVRGLVYGAMFTRGPEDLHQTAIFVGGSNVAAGEELLAEVRQTFFGPMRVSVLMDANGANTTAAAAVLAVGKHLDLKSITALVLAGTGPVGQRVARLLAGQGSTVRVASRSQAKAQAVCEAIVGRIPDGRLSAVAAGNSDEAEKVLDGVDVVIAAGAAGIELLSAAARRNATSLKVAVDLNAVPPVGLAGIKPTDKAADRDGIIAYGAIGVGGLKMKIHKRAIQQLFEANDQILDAEEVLALGKEVLG